MKRFFATLLLLFNFGYFFTSAEAAFITDGDFSNFSFDTTGTATALREAGLGNPGARINMTTVSGADVYATAIKTDFVTSDSLVGKSFILSLDVLSGTGAFGQGQAISLLVAQGGAVYAEGLGNTGFPLNFDTVSFNGVFNATDFTLLIGAGPANPDLTGGTATQFGFAAENYNSGTLTQYYDNFQLAYSASSAVPEPSTFALVGLGGLGLVISAFRQRRAIAI